jgi:hypothetical protein
MLHQSSITLMNVSDGRQEKVDRVKAKRQFQLMAALLIIFILALNTIAPEIATTTQCILASLIIFVCALPTLIYFSRRETGIPFLPIWGMAHAMYYGIPIYTLNDYMFNGHGTEAGITTSLLIALIGAVLLLLAFYKLPRSVTKFVPQVSINLQPLSAKIAAVALGAIGLYVPLMLDLAGLSNFNGIIAFISQWASLAIAILFVLSLRGQLNFFFKLILFGGLIPALLLIHLGSGLLMNPLRDLLLLLFLYWGVRRKIPVKAVVIGLILMMPFMGFKKEFRQLTWEGDDANASIVQKGFNYIDLVYKGVMSDSKETYQSSIDSTVTRIAYLQTMATVVEETPEIIPYWYGETYKNVFIPFIPRFLWPDKPEMTLGQSFGHRYLILDDFDTWTSWNLPQIIEFYANFGWIGVVLGMPLVGVIYRMIYEGVNQPNSGDGGVVLAAMVFMGLANFEGDFSLVFGGVLQTTLLFLFILRFIGSSSQKSKKSSPGMFGLARPALNK